MKTSYDSNDVTLLLKDITGLVEPETTEERERQIQSGRHYCEMLPLEYEPTQAYMEVYHSALTHFTKETAHSVGRLAHKIAKSRGKDVVLVSLARAGIPAGILLKRYLYQFFQWEVPHYSISIIRGRGIDKVAMNYLLEKYEPDQLLFVDGWIGKGAILGELKKEIEQFPKVSPELAVLADPANETTLFGTQKDILIPSACLNSTVSGLISRTFLRDDIIKEGDFHGAVYYGQLQKVDRSLEFLETVGGFFQEKYEEESDVLTGKGVDEVCEIARENGISNINLVKSGIGETTRVLLRRVPWKVLIHEKEKDNPSLAHIYQLAKERNVPIEFRTMKHYLACGLIKQLGDV